MSQHDVPLGAGRTKTWDVTRRGEVKGESVEFSRKLIGDGSNILHIAFPYHVHLVLKNANWRPRTNLASGKGSK